MKRVCKTLVTEVFCHLASKVINILTLIEGPWLVPTEEVLPLTPGGQLPLVPAIPRLVAESQATTLLGLWRHALWNQQLSLVARRVVPGRWQQYKGQ